MTSSFLTRLPWNFRILHAIHRGIIHMSICRFTVRWFCVILLLLITSFFDKIAILTNLSAKSLEQKSRHDLNVKITTIDGLQSFDRFSAYQFWLKSIITPDKVSSMYRESYFQTAFGFSQRWKSLGGYYKLTFAPKYGEVTKFTFFWIIWKLTRRIE